jgi:DUF4097 and DUF4098 domain-containing protein YvlB
MPTTSSDFVRTFAVSGPLQISVELGSGEIAMTAGEVTEASVTLEPGTAGDTDALDLIARARVDMRGTALRIDVPRAMGFQRHPDVVVVAQVPVESTVVTRSGSADVRLDGTYGDVKVTTGSGDVSVDAARDASIGTGSGDVRIGVASTAAVKTGSGDIAVERCRDDARLETASGDVHVSELGGRGRVSSASGDVELGSVEGDIHLKTASGDVTVSRASAGELQAKTATGNVAIGIASGTAALLDCSSITGQVSSELEPSDEPAEGDERRLVVRVRTVSGSVAIRRA